MTQSGRGFRVTPVHSSHRPEPDGERIVDGCTSCTACCRIVSTDRLGPTRRGREECGGNPGLSLRAASAAPPTAPAPAFRGHVIDGVVVNQHTERVTTAPDQGVSVHILLSGIVGSTAYGLNRPGSDIDRLGVIAMPTTALVGLHPPRESHVTTKPDRTLHEARKFCILCIGGNPTAFELLWLPDDLYEERTPLGDELIGLRSAFLSAPRVRDAYLGYAMQQFRRLTERGDGSFSADLRKRTAKHARHLARLTHQGVTLYTTGQLTIRLGNPQWYHEFGDAVAGGDIQIARDLLDKAKRDMDTAKSPLPELPDTAPIEAWLLRVRQAHWDPAGSP